MKNTFRKYERLCQKSSIDLLFTKGHSIYSFPIGLKWIMSPVQIQHAPCQILFVASKKIFRHAVERNKIKRLFRECFRENKHELYSFLSQHNTQIQLAVYSTKKQKITKEEMKLILTKLFVRLMDELSHQITKKNQDEKV